MKAVNFVVYGNYKGDIGVYWFCTGVDIFLYILEDENNITKLNTNMLRNKSISKIERIFDV